MKNLLLAAATAPFIAFSASALAAGALTELDTWRASAMSCGQGLQGLNEGGEFSQMRADFTDCMVDDAVRLGWDAAVGALNTHGKLRFGAGFSVNSRLHYAGRSDAKVSGDLDLVMPLNARGDANAKRAWFLQNGVTRWTDSRGEVRHDARFGGVHRFALNGTRGGLLSLSALLQENREYGHRRMVAGVDYSGGWGSGGLNWYRPLTEWLPGRAGYEERALEGVDLALNLNMTTTVDMRATFGRWQQTIDPDATRTQASLGFDWRPHEWLRLGANLRGVGSDAGSEAIYRARVEIPLGGPRKAKPRWQGFGVAVADSGGGDIWRGVTHATRIEYAEREAQTAAAGTTVDGVTVRFLQAAAFSGEEIQVEVSLPAPAEADTPLLIRLRPGDGDDLPAEADVDYADEPTRVTIRAGESSAIATISLLNNSTLSSARSLGVTVQAG